MANFIQYEVQDLDNMCGLHTINTLFQNPVQNEVSLSSIAMDLNKQEMQLTGDQNFSNQNLDLSGNFNVQVLMMALQSLGNWNVIYLKPDQLDKHANQPWNNFIINSRQHWYTLRIINNHWVDFNSIAARDGGPKILPQSDVISLVKSLLQEKQSVFTVVHESVKNPFEKISIQNNPGNRRNLTSSDNPLNNLLAKSQQEKKLPDANPALSQGNKNQIYENIHEFLKKRGIDGFISFTGSHNTIKTSINSFDEGLSLFWENIGTNVVQMGDEGDLNVKCRMADGKSQMRKFKGEDLVSEIQIWVHNYNLTTQNQCKKFTLKQAGMPPKNIDNPFITINEAGIKNNTNLNVIKL